MWNANGYEQTFARFDAANGRWIPTWNWGAFIFGLVWYLYKGLWAKALIWFVALLILSAVSGGILAIPLWVAWGVLGNYDMYLLYRKGTQLWHGAGIHPDALPGVTAANADRGVKAPHSSATARMDALDRARAQGVISEAEYAAKRVHIETDHERERKLAALYDMRRNGLISDLEFEQKRREVEAQSVGGSEVPQQNSH